MMLKSLPQLARYEFNVHRLCTPSLCPDSVNTHFSVAIFHNYD